MILSLLWQAVDIYLVMVDKQEQSIITTSVETLWLWRNKILFLEPRPVRHAERIGDLLYVLFKRKID